MHGPRRSIQALAAIAAAAALVVAAAGCGTGEKPADLANGKELFVGKGTCGACHTMRRAGTKGSQGPNLDSAFGPSRQDGLGDTTVEGVVRDQIANVRRGSVMPADLVKGDDARDVAAYVALVAGQPGDDQGALAAAGKPKTSSKPIAADGGLLEIAADPSGALAFASTKATAPAGSFQLVMPNPSPVDHNIAVKGDSVDEKGPVVGNGGKSELAVELEAGKYTFYCSVPGHEEGGMKGELTVE